MRSRRAALGFSTVLLLASLTKAASAASVVLDPGPGTDYLSVWCGGQTVSEIATGFDASANPVTLVKVATTCHGSGRGSPNQYYLACWGVTFTDAGAIDSKTWLATNHWSQGNPSIPCPVAADPAATFTATDGAGNFPDVLSTTLASGSQYRAVLDTSCTPIAYAGSAAGTIGAPGESACFSLRGSVGDQIQLDAATTSGTLKPVQLVSRPDGTELCAGAASVDCTLDAAGRQVIVVSDESGTGVGEFTLGLTCTSPSCQPFNYALTNAGGVTVVAGAAAGTTITASLTGGITEDVTFAIAGLPTGADASFDVASCAPDCVSNLTITTSSDTPGGTYPITVTAEPLSRATTFTLTVTEATTGCGGIGASGWAGSVLPASMLAAFWSRRRSRRRR